MSKTTSTSTREFRVRWEIDLTADSPEAAARQALEIQRAPAFFATIFEVKWRDPDNVDAHGNGSAHGQRKRKNKLLVDALAVKAAQKPEPQPDNESERTVNGVRLRAVPRLDDFVECRGCYLFDDPALAPAVCNSPSCIGRIRADRQDIIWVRQDA